MDFCPDFPAVAIFILRVRMGQAFLLLRGACSWSLVHFLAEKVGNLCGTCERPGHDS